MKKIIIAILLLTSRSYGEYAFRSCRDLFSSYFHKTAVHDVDQKVVSIFVHDSAGSRLKARVPYEPETPAYEVSLLSANSLAFLVINREGVEYHNYITGVKTSAHVPWEVHPDGVQKNGDHVLSIDPYTNKRVVVVSPVLSVSMKFLTYKKLEIKSDFSIKNVRFSEDGTRIILEQIISNNLFQIIEISRERGNILSQRLVQSSIMARLWPIKPKISLGLSIKTVTEFEETTGD